MGEIEDIVAAATEPRVKWARAEAKKIWKKQGGGAIPADPEKIIQEFGIPLKEDDLNNMDGVCHCDANGLLFIMYKRSVAEVRKRFTLAHELGHFALDHVGIGESSQHSSQSQEKEANEFANELLVPSEDLKKFMKERPRDLPQIMERYGVSRDVAYYAVMSAKLFMKLKATAVATGVI